MITPKRLFILICLVFAFPHSAFAATDRVIVKVKPGLTITTPAELDQTKTFDSRNLDQGSAPQSLIERDTAVKIQSVDHLGKPTAQKSPANPTDERVYVLTTSPTQVDSLINDLEASGDYEYVEPDHVYSLFQAAVNDPFFLDQSPPSIYRTTGTNVWNPTYDYLWNLKNIHAPEAWNYSTGSQAIKVAVLDTGIDYTHPELAGITLTLGRDYVNEDDDPRDDLGHGTAISGLIAAAANNGIGTVGLNHHLNLIVFKVLDKDGSGFSSNVAAAVQEAIAMDVDVINISFGGEETSQTLSDALDEAHDAGIIITAAVGNQSQNANAFFPASHPHVIAVSGVRENDDFGAGYSNYGSLVDVAAPGGNITGNLITLNAHDPDNPAEFLDLSIPIGDKTGFQRGVGTSYAVPHVSGLAALIIDYYTQVNGQPPTPNQVETIITTTAKDLGDPGKDDYFGYGRIDAGAALTYIASNPPPPTPTPTPTPSTQAGDVNDDGVVNLTDYNLVVNNVGSTNCDIITLDLNCKVSIYDLNVVVANLNR